MERIFIGQVIGVTGSGPWEEHIIRRIVHNDCGFLGTSAVWQRDQIIVVGTDNFDKEYLKASINVGKNHDFVCIYLSQEDFLHYCRTRELPGYYRGDPRILNHAGLTRLTSLGFRWPSTEASPGVGRTTDSDNYATASELTRRFRYSVAAGVPEHRRKQALSAAVQDPPRGMGLYAVAHEIASLIKWRKSQTTDRLRDAISRWEHDLDWLYHEYYLPSFHSFDWPSESPRIYNP